MGVDRTDSTTRDDDTPTIAAGEDSDRSAEQTDGQRSGPSDDRIQQRAETRTREQYADAMRADGSPMSRDNSRDNREPQEDEPPGRSERQGDQAADDRAEPRDRETYAHDVRADCGPDDNQGPADAPADTTLDSPSASNSHRVDENELVSLGEQAEGDRQPETVTFEGKDLEVTHNAADGIWIEGLPGEPPTRIGDLVTSAEDPTERRGEKLRREVNREAEDISDTASTWADHVQEILDPPRPTHSMTHNRSPETTIAGSEHGISAGHGAEAVVTLAIAGAAVIHKLHERWQRAWDH